MKRSPWRIAVGVLILAILWVTWILLFTVGFFITGASEECAHWIEHIGGWMNKPRKPKRQRASLNHP